MPKIKTGRRRKSKYLDFALLCPTETLNDVIKLLLVRI